MEIVLFTYMVMLGGFLVWCFWWGFSNYEFGIRNYELEEAMLTAIMDKKQVALVEWYLENLQKGKIKGTKTVITNWTDITISGEIINEYWKNT